MTSLTAGVTFVGVIEPFLPSRRRFLSTCSLAVAGAAMWPKGFMRAAGQPVADPSSRAAFDALDRAWNHGNAQSEKTNEDGALGWGQSAALAAYVVMYRAHGDVRYLEKLVEQFDRVLKNRDSERGVKDYRGLSLPAWQSAGRYTCGAVAFNDDDGKPLLTVRTASRPVTKITAQIVASPDGRSFTLRCRRPAAEKMPAADDVYEYLTMSPASDRYAPKVINARFGEVNRDGKHLMITAVDPRPARSSSDALPPAGEPVVMKALPYVYAVHAGMLFQPVLEFARLVVESPELSSHGKFRDKAAEYVDAAERAMEIFDDEWREDAATGEGWLIWRRGAPIAFDGCDQPHNQYLALGSAMTHLSSVTTKKELRETCRDRAAKMARTFKNDLKPAANDGYTWTYFWTKGKPYNGWSAADDVSDYQPVFVHAGRPTGHRQTEDSSHGHIDTTFARLAFDYKLGGFDEADMRRLAATYAKNILDGERSSDLVDGTDREGTYDNSTPNGIPFARWEPSIVEKCRALYTRGPAAGAPQGRLLGTAYLNLAAAREHL